MTTEDRAAIVEILNRLKAEGLAWYRQAKSDEADYFEKRVSGAFSVFDTGEIYTISGKPRGSFPGKKILVVQPSGRETKAILGLSLKWDFDVEPFEFRLFLGQWSEIDDQKTFIAYRFEAPEKGDEHNYFHCQPCRDFGDREPVPHAALVSHRFPTIPLKATNIVDLTLCALMSILGRKKAKRFVQKLLQTLGAESNHSLRDAYFRCIVNQ